MFEKDVIISENKYVSCIKINGVPILAPLITHAKRKDIYRYRQQAIKLEKRLKRERELRQYIDKYYTPNLENYTNPMVSATLEHRLAFEDDVLHIKNIENGLKDISFISKVPSIVQRKSPCLSSDLQVSQYANNEFTVLTSFDKSKSSIISIDELPHLHPENNISAESTTDKEVDISDTNDQKPRLIRSNSYTLDSPSPMLIDHLRKQKKLLDGSFEVTSLSQMHDEEVCQSNKVDMQIMNMSTISNDPVLEDGNNPDYSTSADSSKTESELRNISTCLSDQISITGDFTLTENHCRLKAFIDNNVPQILNKQLIMDVQENESVISVGNTHYAESSISHLTNVECNSNTPTEQLLRYDKSLEQILNNIPDIYSRQIVELLEKQKQGHLPKTNIQIVERQLDVLDTSNGHDELTNFKCILHEDKLISSLGTNEVCQDLTLYGLHRNSPDIVQEMHRNFKEFHNGTVLNCSRELFPSSNKHKSLLCNQNHAASIIGAAAKGYLVRRLMRTDRVQGLIQTIRESLICAMQLHTENADSINESDVELHRRLIQQVSAACIEFYDVFFTISASEQMTIIKLDRERLKEKSKRPHSRVSSAGHSARSSRSVK